MIYFHCDGCGKQLQHDGPDAPAEWAEIIANVKWRKGDDEGYIEYEGGPVLLCPTCKPGSAQALCAQAERGLQTAVDQRPKVLAAPYCPRCASEEKSSL